MTPFTNEHYWQTFCDWIASQGPDQAREIMSDYIEENFEHFMQFVENRRLLPPKK
jgi:hypothetical protein